VIEIILRGNHKSPTKRASSYVLDSYFYDIENTSDTKTDYLIPGNYYKIEKIRTEMELKPGTIEIVTGTIKELKYKQLINPFTKQILGHTEKLFIYHNLKRNIPRTETEKTPSFKPRF